MTFVGADLQGSSERREEFKTRLIGLGVVLPRVIWRTEGDYEAIINRPTEEKEIKMDKLQHQMIDFFAELKDAKNDRGQIFKPETAPLTSQGWKAIGYTMVASSTALVDGTAFGRSRMVAGAQGPAAIAEFDEWVRGRIIDGFVPGWRYYISHRRCIMDNSEFKGTICYREDTKDGSVLVEFIPTMEEAPITKVDFNLLTEVFSDEMNIEAKAKEFLMLSQMAGLGADVQWMQSAGDH